MGRRKIRKSRMCAQEINMKTEMKNAFNRLGSNGVITTQTEIEEKRREQQIASESYRTIKYLEKEKIIFLIYKTGDLLGKGPLSRSW